MTIAQYLGIASSLGYGYLDAMRMDIATMNKVAEIRAPKRSGKE